MLVVEARYAGAGAAPPAHLHPDQDERFEVHAGAMRTRIAGQEVEHGAGEAFDVRRGTAHQMWNSGAEEARMRWTTSPAGRTLDSGQPGLGVALWMRAADAQALHDQLSQHGVTILTEPIDGPFGGTFTLRDPDGYAITIHDKG